MRNNGDFLPCQEEDVPVQAHPLYYMVHGRRDKSRFGRAETADAGCMGRVGCAETGYEDEAGQACGACPAREVAN